MTTTARRACSLPRANDANGTRAYSAPANFIDTPCNHCSEAASTAFLVGPLLRSCCVPAQARWPYGRSGRRPQRIGTAGRAGQGAGRILLRSAAWRSQRHEGPRRIGKIVQRADGPGAVPVDERYGYPVTVDGVPRTKVAMGNDLPSPGRTRVEAVAGDRGLEAGSRRVQLAKKVRHGAQGTSVWAYGGSRCPCPGSHCRSTATPRR